MPRHVIILAVIVATLAACGSAATSPTPTTPPSSPSTALASPEQTPTQTTVVTPNATPRPTATPVAVLPFTADERYLQRGILRDAVDCRPARDDLPKAAVAGIECDSNDSAVSKIGFYLFTSDASMLAAYFARMDLEGVKRDTGSCFEGEGDGQFIPGPDELASRNGCFVNDDGYANYRLTLPGSHVYVGILGRSRNTRALADFAWRGNQDQPGYPTIWSEPNP